MNPLILWSSVGIAGLLVLGVVLVAVHGVAMTREVLIIQKRQIQTEDSLHAALSELARYRKQLEGMLDQIESQAPAAGAISMPLATRHKALKLARKGQPPAEIARALQVMRGEVTLLLKVGGASARAYDEFVEAESTT